jgi:murein DD-endopeptidase MepM/ murein hydrolase activator NlpD
LAAILLVAVLLGVHSIQIHRNYAIDVDGKLLGVVSDPNLVDDLVKTALADQVKTYGRQVDVQNAISVVPVWSRVTIKAVDLNAKLAENLKYGTAATAIVVDGKEVMAVADEDTANRILDAVKVQFTKARPGRELVTASFVQAVTLARRVIPPDLIVPEDQAISRLLRGTDKRETHTVSRGESYWTIAGRYGLTPEALQAANPSVPAETLQPGQQIDLLIPQPYLDVQTVEKVTVKESIPYETTYRNSSSYWRGQSVTEVAGRVGTREVLKQVTSVNGKQTAVEVLSTAVVSNPTTRVVVRGTKDVPALATGQFTWPVQGTITSLYGYRWGTTHRGVDIGAPTGTPIKASDTGLVTQAGWNGGLGYSVTIEHGNGYTTIYGHMSKVLVSSGKIVTKGDIIGKVGSTGQSTGPHLHFQVERNTVAVNPLQFFK